MPHQTWPSVVRVCYLHDDRVVLFAHCLPRVKLYRGEFVAGPHLGSQVVGRVVHARIPRMGERLPGGGPSPLEVSNSAAGSLGGADWALARVVGRKK